MSLIFDKVGKLCIIGLVLILTSTLYGCKEDYLETINKSNLTDVTLWESESNADIFLNDCYGDLVQKSNSPDNLDNFTDDFDTPSGNVFTSFFWKGGLCFASRDDFTAWGGQAGPCYDANWPGTFEKIRKLNTFIQKMSEYAQNFSEEYKSKRIDEAKFLRAYFYSELFMRVGGLPIITAPQDRVTMTEEELLIPRSSFEETFNFIITELDGILNNNNLEIKYHHGDQDAGRATLGAALALKGWLQLFAASPAYNSSDPAVPSGSDNLQSFATPNSQRWADAAATNKKFIEMFGHKGTGEYNLFPKMSQFWDEANEYNEEVIWDRQQVGTTMPNTLMVYGGGPVYVHDIYYNWGNFNPTQELVEQFQMANGKDITDLTSGYDDQNPYVNREKRFYDFIMYDGASYKFDWMSTPDIFYSRIDLVNPSKNEIDFSGADATKTGYQTKKRVDNFHSAADNTLNGMNNIYYRYAEVLLNYAEAQNEAVGPDASVYEAINAIRTRPGTDLPELEAGLSQSEMRKAIHRERRIELCFEEKRLFDLWRWKDAESLLNKVLNRCKIYNSKPQDNSGAWVYEIMPLDLPHVFTQKMYFNPIPQSAIDRNPKLKQNWGY
ncbi:MAG: RagB/SusD family nutrient uptake outer membrane protein [Chitinophagaceae bacterium]|nr:RagB/SusD family nutrient uptake outer membrane protein [Chitinophagaceae bacterium]